MTRSKGATVESPPPASSRSITAVLKIDRVVHEPARLVILAVLNGAEEVDFRFLSIASGLTKGNLSRQAANLADAGYITIRKYFKGRIPATGYQITEAGKAALRTYWETLTALQQGDQAPMAETRDAVATAVAPHPAQGSA
jgi:DNA-binding transcriptional ArsR family regulator